MGNNIPVDQKVSAELFFRVLQSPGFFNPRHCSCDISLSLSRRLEVPCLSFGFKPFTKSGNFLFHQIFIYVKGFELIWVVNWRSRCELWVWVFRIWYMIWYVASSTSNSIWTIQFIIWWALLAWELAFSIIR